MSKLYIGVELTYDFESIEADSDFYDIDEVVEMLRIDLENTYHLLGLEVSVRDYFIDDDGSEEFIEVDDYDY